MIKKEIKQLLNEEERIFAGEANLIKLESDIRISVNRMPSYRGTGPEASS